MRRLLRTLLLLVSITAIALGSIGYLAETKRPVDFSPASAAVEAGGIKSAAEQLRQEAIIRSVADRVLTDRAFGSATNSCIEVRVGSRTIYESGQDNYLTPASGMKLLTAHATLEKQRALQRQKTTVYGTVNSNGIATNVILVGTGDPFSVTTRYASNLQNKNGVSIFDQLANQLKARGVKQVSGTINVDDSMFDDKRRVTSWPATYGATVVSPIGALSVNANQPLPEAPAAGTDPAVFAGEALKITLNARSIAAPGNVVHGKQVNGTKELASTTASTFPNQVGRMLRDSDNTAAEVLIKLLGANTGEQGTTSNGIIEARKTYGDLDIGEGFVQTDGSGLSTDNKVRCTTLLNAFVALPMEVKAKMSVAGETGTLSDRLIGTFAAHNLRAKTGTLNGASSLTGEVQTRGGLTIEFSAIINGVPNDSVARQWQDTLATALSEVR